MTKEETAKEWQKEQDALLHYEEPVTKPSTTEAERIEKTIAEIREMMARIKNVPVTPATSASETLAKMVDPKKKQYGIAKESMERYEKENGKPYVLRDGEYVI